MTHEELPKPKYKVIAPYPLSPYKVGDLMQFSEDGKSVHLTTTWFYQYDQKIESDNFVQVGELAEYPNLFEQLQWWEHLNLDEMPKYLKAVYYNWNRIGDVIKSVNWQISAKGVPYFQAEGGQHFCDRNADHYAPVTKNEYETYLKTISNLEGNNVLILEAPEYIKELIEITNSESELMKERDKIYSERLYNNNGNEMDFKFINSVNFKKLLFGDSGNSRHSSIKGAIQYFKEKYLSNYNKWSVIKDIPAGHAKIYCEWFASNFDKWKSENSK